MPRRSSLILRQWSGLADVHRDTYRIFCVIAGVLNPLFGVVYGITDPSAFDPLWARFVLALLALLLISLSYMVAWVEQNFILLVRAYFYLLITFIVGITALNGFSHHYTLGMLFAFTAMGVAFSLGLRKRIAPLQRFLAFTVALTVPAGLLIPTPGVSIWIVWICTASTALVIYVGAAAKIRAEESMEASEHRYHTLMNAASDAIFIADPGTGILIDANEKAQELTGRSSDEIRRMHLSELFPLEERERSAGLFEAHVYGREPITEDFFLVNRSGECIPIDISASLIDVGGRKLIQGIFRRHRYEEQLIQAKDRAEELLRLKTSLLNNMSHELRTPLTSILGFAEILSEESTDDQQEHARVIITSAKRLYETVNSILGLAQLESGTASLELKVLDLAAYMRESIPLLRPLADQKGIGLHVSVQTDAPFARADEVCLSRIMNNLVGNAIKFTEEGSVTVEIDADEERVFVRVRDTGIGISASFLPHLFDEFRQESTGLARSHEGSGLGLAITKRLVELMQGEIEVESRKGVGSTFTVSLPRAAAGEGDGLAPPAPSLLTLRPTQRRVLLVEDNPSTRSLIAHRLGALCQVEAVADPRTAIELAAQNHFDAFLLDINLSATRDGVDLLRTLRRMRGSTYTPSVALTAYAMPGDEERFLEAGFDYYLSKPFTKQQLLSMFLRLFPSEQVERDELAAGPTPTLNAPERVPLNRKG